MFFIFSKTVNYLLQPLSIVFLIGIAAYILRKNKWGKRLRITSIGLLILFSNDFIANELIRLYETPVTPLSEIKKSYEYGIVLTGVTATDKELRDRVYVVSSPDRVNHSALLYQKGIIRKLLISGGSGKLLDPDYSEARQLFSLYTRMGVDSSDIIIEGDSRNTHESAVAVRKILEKVTTPESCLLITSGYHMPRSLACFKKENWNCDTFSTDIRFHSRDFTPDVLFIPRVEAIANWQTLLKEWVGIIAYWLSGYV
jgi:uncharacterized SAM-binding protein YcdF (DUF218 family)